MEKTKVMELLDKLNISYAVYNDSESFNELLQIAVNENIKFNFDFEVFDPLNAVPIIEDCVRLSKHFNNQKLYYDTSSIFTYTNEKIIENELYVIDELLRNTKFQDYITNIQAIQLIKNSVQLESLTHATLVDLSIKLNNPAAFSNPNIETPFVTLALSYTTLNISLEAITFWIKYITHGHTSLLTTFVDNYYRLSNSIKLTNSNIILACIPYKHAVVLSHTVKNYNEKQFYKEYLKFIYKLQANKLIINPEQKLIATIKYYLPNLSSVQVESLFNTLYNKEILNYSKYGVTHLFYILKNPNINNPLIETLASMIKRYRDNYSRAGAIKFAFYVISITYNKLLLDKLNYLIQMGKSEEYIYELLKQQAISSPIIDSYEELNSVLFAINKIA